ncbi:hypothetical protein DCO58_06960 [Helicobacter saguini]|uniref:Uncharacterized protein n=1 Tax=Helicobacter saguini TaxID=1548018 RepID=A0A347VN28_9HELI|nr:hypothetical protein [Helicobacter saguini]MWV61927.1 hypothetical protein [Helicobacter saguini]MWV67398.1 hypothetical protein [Helicobacter saguini]MWV69751.1 hypothetical protein [Helicobacter saguini]MWV73032.1 hypothetical protein [Helicobacter saguini]TLD95592.1 hypothetical protein LS64_001685 [Helicobacter saguini]
MTLPKIFIEIGKIAAKYAPKILDAIKKYGPLIIEILKNFKDLFKDTSQDIKVVANHISELDSLNTEDIEQVTITNALLNIIVNKTLSQTQDLENELVAIYTANVQVFESFIESSNSLQQNIDLVKLQMNGIVKKNIISQISISNNECLKILKLGKGEFKGKKMQDFVTFVLIDSIKECQNILQQNMQSLSNNIKENIESNLKIQEIRLKESSDFLTQMIDSKDTLQKHTAQINLNERIFIESSALYNINSTQTN